jgi:ankyrin repeat protein
LACISGEIDLIKLVLEKGANANAFRGKLITFAAASNRMDMWDMLLEHGADPSQACVLEGMKTLVQRGKVHLLPLLAKLGVDISEVLELLACKTAKAICWDDFNDAWRATGEKISNTDE